MYKTNLVRRCNIKTLHQKQITLTNIKGENYGKYIIWWKL